MTKAELYKRRNKNKQRTSSAEAPAVEFDDPNAELLNSIKSRTEKNSIENDVELIKANTIDTPVEETKPQFEETEDIPPVKPVENLRQIKIETRRLHLHRIQQRSGRDRGRIPEK